MQAPKRLSPARAMAPIPNLRVDLYAAEWKLDSGDGETVCGRPIRGGLSLVLLMSAKLLIEQVKAMLVKDPSKYCLSGQLHFIEDPLPLTVRFDQGDTKLCVFATLEIYKEMANRGSEKNSSGDHP